MKFTFLVFLSLLATLSWGEVFYIEDYDVYFDPLEEYILLEGATPESLSLSDPTGTGLFQILLREENRDLQTRVDDLAERLSISENEWATWVWENQVVALGDVLFQGPWGTSRAYLFLAQAESMEVTLLAFSDTGSFEAFNDDFLSIINSLAISTSGRKNPGPISEYLYQSTPESETSFLPTTLNLPSGPLDVEIDQRDLDIQNLTIEREARIMQRYENDPLFPLAWSRYYRQIFRDSYASLEAVANLWSREVQETELRAQELPEAVLSWLQGFDYSRRGGLSDLYPPFQTLVQNAGDCDSLALIYTTLMEQLGYPSILMVSQEYAHAMGAILYPVDGAVFSFGGQNYTVAELTAEVDLGMVDQNMSDPSYWMGIDLWGDP